MTMPRPSAPAWQYNTVSHGIVTQFDVAGIINELLDEGISLAEISMEIKGVSQQRLRDISNGDSYMGQSIGQRFINWLDERDAEKKRAAAAATEAAQETQTTTGASEDIVPQEDDHMATLTEEKHTEMQSMMEQITRERDSLRQRVADLELIRDLVRQLLVANAG